MKHLRILLRTQFILLALLLVPQIVTAQWVADGNPVCTQTDEQLYVVIASDGAGGAIMAWEDRQYLDNRNIYAQRVDGDGNPLWTTNGIPICTYAENQELPKIVPDGSGGAIIAWTDYRHTNGFSLYAQRVNAAGVVQWTVDGHAAAVMINGDRDWAMVEDGTGGALFAWRRFEAGPGYVIRAQRLDASGTSQFGLNGVLLCTDYTGTRRQVNMTTDGSGGAIVVWNDLRTTLPGIYAQRISAAGTVQWATDGEAVCTADFDFNMPRPVIVPTSFSSSVIAWQGLRDDTGDVYAQKLNLNGTPQWTSDGVPVCVETGVQMSVDMVHDGSGGVFITWADARVDTNIYAQHLDNSGAGQWSTNGLAVCTAPKWQLSPRIVASNSYSAIITWEDRRDSPHLIWSGDIYAQRVTDSGGGGVWWTPDGIPICTASEGQSSPVITTDGSSGAIIAWNDTRNDLTTETDIYAQRTYYDACSLVPTSLQFGEVELGSYSDLTFEVVAGAILNGEVTESCAEFDIISGGGPFTLAPGESHEVTVRYEPTTVGEHSCYADMGDDLCRATILWRGKGCPGSVVYVDADATGTGDGSSWANAVNELRDAYAFLDVCSGITEFWVAEGTYLPTAGSDRSASFELRDGLAIYGGFDGTETTLGQRDVAAHPTILSGDLGGPGKSDNSYHVVDGSNVGATAILDGFTLLAGYADGAGDDEHGAGMLVVNGSPTVNNITFSHNTAVNHGGGMYIEDGSPALVDVLFFDNASEVFGGGLTNWSGSPTITRAIFHENSASGGGGMYSGGGTPTLTNVHFDGNGASNWGGGFYANGNATLVNGVFRNNSAQSGGGAYNFFSLSATYTNVTFNGNFASNRGGAMYSNRSVSTLTNVIMWENVAPLNPEMGFADGTPVVSYSLIQGCGGSGISWNPLIGSDGGHNIDTDPWLKGDDFPNTPLDIYACSPAVDAGDNSAVPGGVTTDVAGDPRIYGGTVDMGAYEHQGPPTGVEDETDESHLPTVTALKGAYPNPFNPTVTVEFDLDRSRDVEVSIYDVQGRLVRNLVSENRIRGTHKVRWEGRDNRGNQVASGIYLLLVRSEGWSDHRKIVLLK